MKKLTISASAKFQEEIIKWRDYFIDKYKEIKNFIKLGWIKIFKEEDIN